MFTLQNFVYVKPKIQPINWLINLEVHFKTEHTDLEVEEFHNICNLNELILFFSKLECDINCGNDTVDCLAKKLPSNQKLDMALGVPCLLMKVASRSTKNLTSGDALL